MLIPSVAPRSLTNQTGIQKVVAKVGSAIPKKLSDVFEMTNSGGLDRIPLFLVALVFVLGARLVKSRDAHERREVLTRDGVTVGSSFFAVPVVKNWMARGLDKISKIPTASDNTKLFSLTDFSLDNLKNWYSNADKMPEKVLTMAKNIRDRGGDVAKAFATLGEEGRKNIQVLLAGKEHTSENIINALTDAAKKTKNFTVDDGVLKPACDNLTKMLSAGDNPLVKAAQRLKALPNLASIVFVTTLLGWGIPAFNIYFTRNKLKNKGAKPELVATAFVLEPKLSEEQKKVINSFFKTV